MMNNAMTALISAMRNGERPRNVVQRMAMQDPRAQMAARMMSGRSDRELEQIVRNMARERNIDIEDLARSMGVTIPSGR